MMYQALPAACSSPDCCRNICLEKSLSISSSITLLFKKTKMKKQTFCECRQLKSLGNIAAAGPGLTPEQWV